MDEIWIRLGLIAGALVVALLVTILLRTRAKGIPRHLQSTGFAPGVYLFTSSTCADCRPARKKLAESLGDSFIELNWEREPGEFHQLGVVAVPATLIVEEDGSGTLFPGQPEKALNRLGP